MAPPGAPDDEFLESTETVSSHPGGEVAVFKCEAQVGGEVACVADATTGCAAAAAVTSVTAAAAAGPD